ncbi:hypothetical protein ACH518_06825 [Methylomonas sp. HW2-6]|uniref:hypothetical protein n=1 Tax=Methylomonas sp. HW2-6 TaxID=3376687 RepID=UPI004041E4CD
MYRLLVGKQRAAGRAFWLAVLVIGGANATAGWVATGPAQSVTVAWTSDEDPDAGGQAA